MHSNHARVKHKIVFNIIFLSFFLRVVLVPSPWMFGVAWVFVLRILPTTCRYPYFPYANAASLLSEIRQLDPLWAISEPSVVKLEWMRNKGRSCRSSKWCFTSSKAISKLFSIETVNEFMSHRKRLTMSRVSFAINASHCPCRAKESSSTSFTLLQFCVTKRSRREKTQSRRTRRKTFIGSSSRRARRKPIWNCTFLSSHTHSEGTFCCT